MQDAAPLIMDHKEMQTSFYKHHESFGMQTSFYSERPKSKLIKLEKVKVETSDKITQTEAIEEKK